MPLASPRTLWWFRCRLVVPALLALMVGRASAQMVFDGNVLWNNNNTEAFPGTLTGQFTGTPPTAAAGCPAGTSSAMLGTVTYTHNVLADPLLSSALYQANVIPNFQPQLGSPAYGNAMKLPTDGFFEQTCYRGAIGPNPGDDWTQGWTYYDSTGAHRHDLHLPGLGPDGIADPDPRPSAVYNNINIYGHQFWSPDSNYEIFGQLRIKSQASLTIAPGVVVREDDQTLGTILVERGGQIWAVGNQCEPIIITTRQPRGQMQRGGCGGIVINGRAKSNSPIVNGVGVGTCNGDSVASEGGSIGFFGGNDDNDCSGSLRYVRVEFSGKEISPNNELNSFTFNACGHNTHGDYLEAFYGADDCFEWFGGAMDQKHLIGIDGTDDGYDWQLGTRNRAQFVVIRCIPICAPEGCVHPDGSAGQFGDKGIEADNNEFDYTTKACSGISNTTIANMTIVGDRRSGTLPDPVTGQPIDATFGPTSGVNFRRGTAGTFLNGIIFNMKKGALKIDDDQTWKNHCAAPPTPPAVYCPGALGVLPITSGQVFVARSQPNPFRNRVNFSFALPHAANVSVEIYDTNGRHLDTVAKGTMAAGQHQLEWNLAKDLPTGVYYYKVLAGENKTTGKLTRVD